MRPVEQQVVVVEHALQQLGVHVRGEETGAGRLPIRGHHGTPDRSTVAASVARVHHARVDRETRTIWAGKRFSFAESPSSCRTRFMRSAESSRSLMVNDGDKPDEIRVITQKPRADAVKRAGPREPLRDRAFAARAR